MKFVTRTSTLFLVLAVASIGAAQESAQSFSSSKDSSGSAVVSKQDAKPATKVLAPADPNAVDSSYHVGIGDDLGISVWREQELSQPVTVRPDGMITLPLLNDVYVVGLTTKGLQDLLTEKLKPFITEPQVTVTVRAIRSRKVFLVGNIKAGAFPLNEPTSVLALIAQAGGLSEFAKGNKIYVLRGTGATKERIPFDYKKAVKGDPKQNVMLMPGDIVVVP